MKPKKTPQIALAKLLAKSTKEEVKAAIPAIEKWIHENRNDIGYCPFCKAHIEDRVESIYAELIASLYRVMRWCEQKNIHEFKMTDIRHLLGQINYTRFGNLVHYGGVVYPIKNEDGKRMRGHFGLNLERAREVFENKRAFPLAKTYNMITGECIEETCVFVKDLPALKQFIDENGQYHPEAFGETLNPQQSKRGVPLVTNN